MQVEYRWYACGQSGKGSSTSGDYKGLKQFKQYFNDPACRELVVETRVKSVVTNTPGVSVGRYHLRWWRRNLTTMKMELFMDKVYDIGTKNDPRMNHPHRKLF